MNGEERNELFAALAQAQSSFEPIVTDSKVDFATRSGQKVKYNYASFAAIVKMAKEPLSQNGLSVCQITRDDKLITVLAHKSGQNISSEINLPTNTNDIKQLGANLSYLRRYQYTSIIGAVITDEDNESLVEGNVPVTASHQQPKPTKHQPPEPTKPPPPRQPLEPEQLLQNLTKTMQIAPFNDTEGNPHPVTFIHPKAPGIVSKYWRLALDGDEDAYRTSINGTFAQNSAKDLTAAQANAVLCWLLGRDAEFSFDCEIKPPAAQEAQALYKYLSFEDGE